MKGMKGRSSGHGRGEGDGESSPIRRLQGEGDRFSGLATSDAWRSLWEDAE